MKKEERERRGVRAAQQNPKKERCRNGTGCPYYQKGTCSYIHDPNSMTCAQCGQRGHGRFECGPNKGAVPHYSHKVVNHPPVVGVGVLQTPTMLNMADATAEQLDEEISTRSINLDIEKAKLKGLRAKAAQRRGNANDVPPRHYLVDASSPQPAKRAKTEQNLVISWSGRRFREISPDGAPKS